MLLASAVPVSNAPLLAATVGVAGAAVSTVKLKPAEAVLTLPTASVAVAVTV